MPVIRPTALRSLQSSLRYSSVRVAARAAPARTQIVAKRFSSSGSHGGGHGESSDLPWLLAALVITPPSCWYLWPDNSSHGHGGHGGHGDHHEEKEESAEEPAEEEPAEEEPATQEVGDDADEKKEEQPEAEEASSDDAKEEKSEGNSEDKKDEPEEKAESGDETKSDSKNRVNKKESALGQTLGETDSTAPAAKSPGKSDGDMSKKQEGLSNTDTKYSVPIDQGTEKSKKADGSPETAKSKGTVDPTAPAPQPPVSRDD